MRLGRYFQIGARWIPKRPNVANQAGAAWSAPVPQTLSVHNLAGPGTYDRNRQITYILTFQAPSKTANRPACLPALLAAAVKPASLTVLVMPA